jgi:hypothetical protein
VLDEPYTRLEGLPRGLWVPVLVASSGTQGDKLLHAEVWLNSLLKGQLPQAGANFGAIHGLPALLEVAQRLALNAMTQARPAQAVNCAEVCTCLR